MVKVLVQGSEGHGFNSSTNRKNVGGVGWGVNYGTSTPRATDSLGWAQYKFS